MASIDDPFALHVKALRVLGQRTGLLASNLANADTPHYKARDIDFRQALDAAGGQAPARTAPGHLAGRQAAGTAGMGYRPALQSSLDGNTVDRQAEQAAFTDNAIRYQATLEFLNSRIRGLRTAITGGQR
ncbi:MAG: flagellar basal body rod protein FlgB [Pseudomonadota bacterium]|nr:flagellar basal body rod protein FlgB [Pseudomonadota bacterium]HJO35837.1 flagellar basal body rod protein FlgB [Gammaproteobacteria bacterium]